MVCTFMRPIITVVLFNWRAFSQSGSLCQRICTYIIVLCQTYVLTCVHLHDVVGPRYAHVTIVNLSLFSPY